MSDEKSPRSVCHLCDRNPFILWVAGETAMNITFPVLMKAFGQYVNRTVGYNHLSLVVACGSLICLSQRCLRWKPSFWSQIYCLFWGVLIDFIAPSLALLFWDGGSRMGLVLPYLSCLTSFWSRYQVVRLVSWWELGHWLQPLLQPLDQLLVVSWQHTLVGVRPLPRQFLFSWLHWLQASLDWAKRVGATWIFRFPQSTSYHLSFLGLDFRHSWGCWSCLLQFLSKGLVGFDWYLRSCPFDLAFNNIGQAYYQPPFWKS